MHVRRSSRLRSNGAPKGFPWAKSATLYHATIALDRVRADGLKPRRALGRDVHATGGGPDESISFTADERVAIAIAVGLRVFARAARGELELGQMIIDMKQLAPKGVAEQLRSMRLTPEMVVHIDAGLVPFQGGVGSWKNRVAMEAYMATDRSLLVDVSERSAGGSQPVYVEGWTSPEILRDMQERSMAPGKLYSVEKNTDRYAADMKFELYKYALSYADWAHECYNPLFMHTSPEVMKEIDENQIGVVSATVDADWVCADGKDLQRLGFDTSQFSHVTLSDWAHGCENRLRHGHNVWTKPRDWDLPEPSDTIYYTGSMAEVRVYDPSLIRNVRLSADVDTFVSDTREAWARKGIEVEDPLAYPHFTMRHPHLAR